MLTVTDDAADKVSTESTVEESEESEHSGLLPGSRLIPAWEYPIAMHRIQQG